MQVEGLSLLGVYSYADSPVVLVTYCPTRVLTQPAIGDDEVSEVKAFPLDRIPWDELAFRSTVDALKDFVRLQRGTTPMGGSSSSA